MVFLALPIIAGVAISMQGILSSKMGDKTGFVETIVLIHLFGLIASLVVYFTVSDRSIDFLLKPSIISIIAGSIGVIIIFCIAKSISANGAVLTIMISILAQMVTSKIIEHYGLFGVPKVEVNMYQLLSVVIIFVGVVIFQKNS